MLREQACEEFGQKAFAGIGLALQNEDFFGGVSWGQVVTDIFPDPFDQEGITTTGMQQKMFKCRTAHVLRCKRAQKAMSSEYIGCSRVGHVGLVIYEKR